ncbi:hypothetical protein Zm00014a_004686 [Zea mays]|uniref:Uncharacterized protein n=1 Tax=Zea mays TaxID=4577 RepID=A0A3L6FZY5_MAIZE|nr:hypothetical protein Zm00014a_004686 [Zea mays]
MLYFKSYVELVFLFSTIIPTYLRLYSYIFLYLYISKVSPRLTPYRLKGKKGVNRFTSPNRLNNYALKGRPHTRDAPHTLEFDQHREGASWP